MAAAATGVAQAFLLLPQQPMAAPATAGGGAMTAARLVGRARGGGGAATVVVARTAAAAAAAASPEGGGFDDEDEDVRFSMSSKHIDTGFLKVRCGTGVLFYGGREGGRDGRMDVCALVPTGGAHPLIDCPIALMPPPPAREGGAVVGGPEAHDGRGAQRDLRAGRKGE